MQIDDKIKDFCAKEYSNLTNNKQQLPTDPNQIELLKQQAPLRKMSAQQISTNNGRWNRDEHIRFVEGLTMYGKNWKLVEEHVGSRSGAQIRSHAQKFFNRLERESQKKQNNSTKKYQNISQDDKLNTKNMQNSQNQAESQLIPQNINISEIQGQNNQPVRRQRFESFDSTASYDPLSEQVEEKQINPETMKQILPAKTNQKKDIGGWIDYYQSEEQKITALQQQNAQQFTKQHLDSQQKIKGIIQLLQAYQNIQEQAQEDYKNKNQIKKSQFNPQIQQQYQQSKFSPAKQQQSNKNQTKENKSTTEKPINYYQQFSQEPLNIDRKKSFEYQILQESEKQKEKIQQQKNKITPERKNSNNSIQNDFNQGIFDDYQMKPKDESVQQTQPKIAHDESFFHYIFSRYGYYFNNEQQQNNQTIKLSQLVDMGQANQNKNINNLQEKENQQTDNNNTNQAPKKRKGSFALVSKNQADDTQQEKLKKLVKPNPQNSTFLTRLGYEQENKYNINNNLNKSSTELDDTNQNSNILEENLVGNSETNIPQPQNSNHNLNNQNQNQNNSQQQIQQLEKSERKQTM